MYTLNINFSDDKKTKEFILGVFNKTVKNDGTIIEKSSEKPVLDINGQEMSIEHFGGISNGSEIYVKDDIVSLVEFYMKKNSQDGL